MKKLSGLIHALAGGAAAVDIAILAALAAIKGESPRGFALPVLVVVLLIGAGTWWLTRPDGDAADPTPADHGGSRSQSSHATGGSGSPLYHLENSPVTIHQLAPPGAGSPLARGLAGGLTELETVKRRLVRAGETNELRTKLPDREQASLADLLTDHGWPDSRRILDEAYGAAEDLWERLQVPSRRWDGGPIPEMIEPRIEEGDDLPGVIAKVEAAIAELRRRQGSDERQADEAIVEFAGVEVGKSRWVKEPNYFNDDWRGVPVVFSVVNPQGSVRARAVRPTVTVRDPDGAVLVGPANARWANPQPPNAEEVERDIPANGALVAIDTVIQQVGGDKFWLVTDENLRIGLKATEAIDGHDFQVTVSIQGENLAETSYTERVRMGFPNPALGDEEPIDTLLPPSPAPEPGDVTVGDEGTGQIDDAEAEGDAADAVDDDPTETTVADEDDPEDDVDEATERRPAARSATGAPASLDKLWVEGRRMLNASGPFAAIRGASVLYGPPPTEAQIDRWQGKVRAALPPVHRRRFRFAPLEAEANQSPFFPAGLSTLESKGARRLRESLDELERIMGDLAER